MFAEACNCPNLVYLSAANNEIEKIPEDISKLKELRTLNLDNNRVIVLPDALFTLVFLNKLHLNDNKIEQLPLKVQNLVNLMEFNIASNKLQDIPTGKCHTLTCQVRLIVIRNRRVDEVAQVRRVP